DSLDVDRVRHSMVALYETLPILSTVISVNSFHFQRAVVHDHQLAFQVKSECATIDQEITRFVGMPCDPEREPPLKLLVLRHADRDTLCFKVDHVLTDAAGAKCLLYLFAEAYSTGKIDRRPNPDRGVGQVLRRFSPLTLLKAAKRTNLPIPGPSLIAGPFQSAPLFIEHARLEPAEFEHIRAVAKRADATLNDVLLAALYRVVFDQPMPVAAVPYPIMVPVDMRRYLPEEKRTVVANLSSAVYPMLSKIDAEPFSVTLIRVKTTMDAFKQAQLGLGAFILMTLGALRGGRILHDRYARASTRGSRFINFTNFGIIDETQLRFDGVQVQQAYGIGPLQYAPGILLALSTFQQTLHLAVQGNDTERFQPFIREFMGSLLRSLRSLH
ncbi:MAG TPA: hypothetical protein VMP08_10595, partial [Anaerolineae bacterium]|nr:hypothetical protein [Anaerolineae bacterium]